MYHWQAIFTFFDTSSVIFSQKISFPFFLVFLVVCGGVLVRSMLIIPSLEKPHDTDEPCDEPMACPLISIDAVCGLRWSDFDLRTFTSECEFSNFNCEHKKDRMLSCKHFGLVQTIYAIFFPIFSLCT